jgi:hypothetical protein
VDFDFDNNLERKETAPCPVCGKHIKRGEMECFHCNYELTVFDIRHLKKYMKYQKRKGGWLAIKIVPVLIFVLAFIFLLSE